MCKKSKMLKIKMEGYMLKEILKKKGIKIEIVSADVIVKRELVPEFKIKKGKTL